MPPAPVKTGGRILGIDVPPTLLARWEGWLAPPVQPFYVDDVRAWPSATSTRRELTPELRDTYKVWRLRRSLDVLWLDEDAFFGLSRAERALLVRTQARVGRGAVPTVRRWSDLLDPGALREQADGHRFVWWPSLVADHPREVLTRFVCAEGVPSRHPEVSIATWRRSAQQLPGARRLAGSFAPSSGANCFGTVMAAAGVEDAADDWMLQEPFLAWLDAATRPAPARDDEPGTVLVWRDGDGLPVHTAVTVGDGWALEKPSQTWWTPRTVLAVSDAIRINRAKGQRLERHRLLIGS